MIAGLLQSLALRAGAQSQDFQFAQAYWGTAAAPSEVGPGDRSVTLSVVVQNRGFQAYSGLDSTLYLQFPFSDIGGGSIAHGYYPGIIPAGQTATLQFQLNIDAAASIGSYSLAMSLRYGSGLGQGQTVFVNILLLGKVELSASVSPSSILSGSTSKLIVAVSNGGTGVASKLSVTLNLPPGLSIAGGGGNHWYLQSIAPNETSTIPVDIVAQSSLAGSLSQIGASMTYVDAYGTGRAVSMTIGIGVTPLAAGYTGLSVSRVFWGTNAVPIQVQPGDDNQPLTVAIANSGTILAQNVTASLIIEPPFSYQYTSSGRIIQATNETSSVGTIMPSGSGSAQFTLSIGANSTSGLYKLKLVLVYLGNSPIQTTVDIPVTGYSDMAVQKVSVLPTKVYPGDTSVDLKVFVTNAGVAPAYNVTLNIVLPQHIKPSWGGADSFFIGTVQPSQIVPADFYIDVDDSAPTPSYPTIIATVVYGHTRNLQTSQEIPLFLSAKSRFDVTGTNIPEIHVSDAGIVVVVTLKNVGAEAAQGTTVELEVSNVFSGTTSDYLGTVGAGEQKTASFILNIDSNAKAGSYILTQRISWSQTGATQLFTQDLSLKLNILENPLVKLLPYIATVFFVIIVAVVLIGVGARRRSRRRLQPKQTLSEAQ